MEDGLLYAFTKGKLQNSATEGESVRSSGIRRSVEEYRAV